MAERKPRDVSGSRGMRRRRKFRRIVVSSVLGLVVLGVVVLALAPTIASGYVPALAQRNINDNINGRATVGSASLSWFGGQRIGPIEVVDDRGRPVADISIESSRGLVAILGIVSGLSSMDLGTTTVRGSATVVRSPDGRINLVEVFDTGPPDAKREEIHLPRGLTARFLVDGLDVTFIDEAQLGAGAEAAVVRIPALSGEASITDATRAEATLAGHFLFGPTAEAATRRGGSVDIRALVSNLTEPDGRLAPLAANYDAVVEVEDVATAMTDVLAGMEGRLVGGIGEQLRAQVRAQGNLERGTFMLTAASPGLNADVRLETVDGVLRTPEQGGRIVLGEGAFLPLVPGFAGAITGQEQVAFDRLPGATITIDDVNIPLPVGGRAFDLRGGRFALGLETGEVRGRVRLPGEGEREYRLAPMSARLSSDDLSERITLRARTSAVLGGESAGTLEVDLAAIDPLDARGRPRPALARDFSGAAELSGFATAIVQPFVDGLGIDIGRDVGPEVDVLLRADSSPGGAGGASSPEGTGETPTRLSLDVRSANITGGGAFLLAGNVLSSEAPGLTLEARTLAPLLSRLLEGQGVTVEQGAGVMVSARDVRLDLSRETAGETGAGEEVAASPDLRALSATMEVRTTPSVGQVMLAERGAQRWSLSEGRALIDAADLGRGVRVLASTSAMLEGRPAGVLDADLRIVRLLDERGRMVQGLPAMNGRVSVQEVATTILWPLLAPMGVDISAAGETLGITMTASSEAVAGAGEGLPGERAGAAAVPRSIVDLRVESGGIIGIAPLAIDAGVLRTREDGAHVTFRDVGALLAPAARDAGVELARGASLRASMRNLALDLAGERPLMERMGGEFEVFVTELALRPMAGGAALPAESVTIQRLIVGGRLAPGRAAAVSIRGSGNQAGAAFSAQGNFELPGLGDAGGVRPVGQMEIRSLPTTLLAMVAPPEPGAALDTARLVQDLIGPTITVNVEALRPRDAGDLDRRLSLSARSARLTAQAAADLGEQSLEVREVLAAATVAPELATMLLETVFGGQLEAPARVDRPARFTLAMQPVTIALGDGLAPDWGRAGEASVRAGLEGQLIASNIVLAATPEQPARQIGALGLQDFNLTLQFPLSSLATGSPPAETRFELGGIVLGSPQQRLMEVRSRGQGSVAGGRPVGPLTAESRVEIADVWGVDRILGQGGRLAQAVGQTMNVQANATAEFPEARARAVAPAGNAGAPEAGGSAFAFDRAALRLTLSSPRLNMTQPLRLSVLPERATLDAPAQLTWTMHKDWGNQFLLGVNPRAPAGPQEARFAGNLPVNLTVSRLTLARGEGVGPMRQGVFEAQIDASAQGAPMEIAGVPTQLSGLFARIIGGREPGVLGFNVRIQDAGGGPAPEGKPAVQFAGGVYQLSDAAGNLTTESAVITADGGAQNIPTAIIDALASQGGMLVDALGPTASLTLNARGISQEGGAINAVATSDRARGELSGIIRGGVFTSDKPANVTLSIITPEFGRRLTRGLPLLGEFQKTLEDQASTVTMSDLVVPLDGDLSRLSGRIVFDPGEARFAISQKFAPVIQFLDQRQAGTVGRRIEPINVAVDNGVLSYDRFNIPMGDFTLGMEGRVNLVSRQLDLITYLPVGTLREEALGDVRGGLGGVLGQTNLAEVLSTVPFRVRGDFESFRIEPDLQLVTQQLQRELLQPDRILGGAAQDILERLNGRRNRQEGPPPAQPEQPRPAPPRR